MTLIQEYIGALTNLYGLVHKRKVADIYNEKNTTTIDVEIIDSISAEALEQQHIYIKTDYFVHEVIILFEDINDEIIKRQRKPHYVPPEEELLKYIDRSYFEKTKQYQILLLYMTKHLYGGNN